MTMWLLRKKPFKVFFVHRADAVQFRSDHTIFSGAYIYEVEPDRPNDIPIGQIFDERIGEYTVDIAGYQPTLH